jgi:hypothetical protein
VQRRSEADQIAFVLLRNEESRFSRMILGIQILHCVQNDNLLVGSRN